MLQIKDYKTSSLGHTFVAILCCRISIANGLYFTSIYMHGTNSQAQVIPNTQCGDRLIQIPADLLLGLQRDNGP